MTPLFRKSVATLLCWVCASPSLVFAAPAVLTPVVTKNASADKTLSVPAPEAQVALLNRLARVESFPSLKAFAEVKKPTEGDVTEALVLLYPDAVKTQASVWREAGVSSQDAEALLGLVRAQKDSLRARGLSAWTFEKRLEKVVAGYASKPVAVPAEVTTASAPGVSEAEQAEIEALRVRLKDVEGQNEKWQTQVVQTQEQIRLLQTQTQEKLQVLQAQTAHAQDQAERLQSEATIRAKALEDAEKAKVADRDAQREEARLLKKLVDDLQDGQKRLESSLSEVDKKATAKNLDDEEVRESITLMRKDLRDNVQDVSVLKQEVAKLMSPEKSHARPLDKALGSKWLPGAAILIAIGAVVISASK